MLDKPRVRPNLAPPSCALALVVALGGGAALTGCADIHPASDDADTGMMESPTDEADQDRQAEENAEEGRDQGGERRQ
jgi:hypothetical protein